jgi:peroxiredoxin
MNAWAQDQNIEKVKLIPDGNAYFTRSMGMLVNKSNLGFGDRSWRYAAVVDNGIIEKLFVEAGQRDNADTDPYEETTPEMVFDYVKSTVREVSTV